MPLPSPLCEFRAEIRAEPVAEAVMALLNEAIRLFTALIVLPDDEADIVPLAEPLARALDVALIVSFVYVGNADVVNDANELREPDVFADGDIVDDGTEVALTDRRGLALVFADAVSVCLAEAEFVVLECDVSDNKPDALLLPTALDEELAESVTAADEIGDSDPAADVAGDRELEEVFDPPPPSASPPEVIVPDCVVELSSLADVDNEELEVCDAECVAPIDFSLDVVNFPEND